MSSIDLGIVLDSFSRSVKEAIRSAAQLGLRRLEMPVVGREVDPSQLSSSGRRHLMHYISGFGLELAALGSSVGAQQKTDLNERLDKTRQVVEMAAGLHVPLVTTHLGRIDSAVLQQGDLVEAVQMLADLSDRSGTFIALETVSADPAAVAELLKRIDCPTLGACYDPGALLLEGFDPHNGLEPLADRILLARARDALVGSINRPGQETLLGQGDLDLPRYLAALDQAGYRGTPFIRRLGSKTPTQDISQARERLQRYIR